VGAGFGSWRHFPESAANRRDCAKILVRLPGLDRRTELLDGVITDMEPVSPWHANIGDILLHILICRAALRRARENDGGPLGVQWGESRTLQFSPDFPTRTFAQY